MDTFEIDIDTISEEQRETTVGIYYIKQDGGKQLVHHTPSSMVVLTYPKMEQEVIFNDDWKQVAEKVVNKDPLYKDIFNKAILKTKSLLDGISDTCHYSIPWLDANDNLITLTHHLTVLEKASDGTATVTLGKVVNESVKQCKTRQFNTLRKENRLLKELNEQAIELNSLLVFSIDLSTFPNGDYFTANTAFKTALGMKENRDGYIAMNQFINTQTLDLEGSTSMKQLLKQFKQLITQDITEFTNVLVKHVNVITGDVVYLKYNARITKYTDDKPIRIHGYVTNHTTDILTQKHNERLNKENKDLQTSQRLAVKSGKVLVWYQNSDDDISEKLFFANDLFFDKLGLRRYKNNHFLLDDFNKTIVTSDADSEKLYHAYIKKNKAIIENTSDGYHKLLVKHINHETKETFYFEHNFIVEERYDSGAVKTRGGFLTDVTKETIYRLEIEYLVQYDTVTNLHNRHYFESYTKNLLPNDYTVIVIDIDGLKFINDAFGHIYGDQAIHLLAEIIKEAFNRDSTLFRIGGDEFVVITEDIVQDSLEKRLTKVHETIATRAKEDTLIFSASIGYDIVTNQTQAFDNAFTTAENIMYRNKLSNRKYRKENALTTILDILYAKTDESFEKYQQLSKMSKKILQQLGYNRQQEFEDIDMVCQLHNIGKIVMPNELLQTDTLSKEQKQSLQAHAEAGYKIVKNLIDSDQIPLGVLHHHEHYDASGYPMELNGKDIPLLSRIFSIVEAYYILKELKKTSKKAAIQFIKDNQGQLFDPDVVKAFTKTMMNTP